MFQLRDESAGYNGHTVLKNITLDIAAGERVALVGPSGAGKSTLLSMLYRQQKARTALIPQDSALVKSLSVYQNIYMGRLNRHGTLYNLTNLVWPRRSDVENIRKVAWELGLDDKMDTPAGELSGGQQQRCAVGRALYCGAEAVLGDEPVSAVDIHQARQILTYLTAAYPTMIVALHDTELALSFTDRIIGLRQGRIELDRPAAELAAADLTPLYRN